MKVIPIALKQQLEAPVATLSTCWTLKRNDGKVFYFTDAAEDITVSGKVFKAFAGVLPSAVESNAQMSVDNLEVKGLLDAAGIQPTELEAGLFDGAEVYLFAVDRKNPNAGVLPLRTGWLGEVSLQKGTFNAELRGLLQAYQQSIVELTSKSCRASLGDERCKRDLTDFTHERVITELEENGRVVTVDGEPFEVDYFAYGQVEVLTGESTGVRMEARSSLDNTLSLLLPFPLPVAVGDRLKLVAGCDRELPTCKNRFGNVANFRGEPWIPDVAALKPGSKTSSNSTNGAMGRLL